MEKPFYSLREAARLAGVPEENLRRSVLLGEIVATPVADDRQYLVAASELSRYRGKKSTSSTPEPRERFFCLAAFAIVAILSVGPLFICLWIGSFQEVDYFCGNCTRTLHTTRLRKTVLITHRIEAGPFSRLVQRVYPAPCRHEWISFREGGNRWRRLMTMEKEGVLSVIPESDGVGRVEFIRGVLRRTAP